MKTFYVTTPIYYSSGKVHIGNSYSTIVCDIFARYHRLKGDDTFFLTGMDEHGLKIETEAKSKGLDPKTFVDGLAKETQDLWKALDITNDDFICTSEERHIKIVQKIFEKLLANGDIYLGEYEGNYCIFCESFFTKSQLIDNNCPDCGRPTTVVKEESYLLKLSKYSKQLLDHIKANPNFIQPVTRKNEVISFIEQGLDDLSVSRTSFKWGIPVKSNPKHVVYVWIDALSNYLTALGYMSDDDSLYEKYWLNGDRVAHVIGKDILRFHAIYWPIMLMALDIPLKFQLYVHGWVLIKDGKMSKSRGNVVYPMDIVNHWGLDPLRLYLAKEMTVGNDGLFTYERFIEKYNAYLANDLGNLVSRTIAMINKYNQGKINKSVYEDVLSESVEKTIKAVVVEYQKAFENFHFQDGLNQVWDLISRANKYIDESTPWVLAKDEKKNAELQTVLYHLYEILRLVAVMIEPVMPSTTKKILEQLGLDSSKISLNDLYYGKTNEAVVSENITILFKRLDIEEELKKLE